MWLWHNAEGAKSWQDVILVVVSFFTFVEGGNEVSEDTTTDYSFSRETKIAGRAVTCEPFEPKTAYPAKTWTCKNMKIDGDYLRYWVVPSFSASYHCGDKMDDWKGRNDFGALCRTLLKKHNVEGKLWAATISEASCDVSKGPRALFVKHTGNEAVHSENGYRWENFNRGRGIVISFQCMITRDS